MRKHPKFDQKQLHLGASALRYYAGLLRLTKTDHEYVDVLVAKVIPLICLLRPDLPEKWMAESKCHLAQRDSLERKAKESMRDVFMDLKKSVIQKNLSKVLAIKQHICIIEAILGSQIEVLSGPMCSKCGALQEDHRASLMPSYIHNVCSLIKSFCYEILKQGRWDLLIKHARVMCSKQYSDDGNPVVYVRYDIYEFTFAPSFYLMLQLDEILAWFHRDKDTIPVWVAWDTLLCVRSASEGSRDYLRKKHLKYDDPKELNRSTYLLYLHGLKAEVRAIKEKSQNKNKVTFCKGEHADNALKIIFKELGFSVDELDQEYEKALPCAIELILDNHIHLRLKVEWAPNIVEICHLHSFQYQKNDANGQIKESENMRLDFMERLLDHPGERQEVSTVYGGNAKQYLEKMGIKGVLYSFFIADITHNKATLRSKYIILRDEPALVLKKLRRHIQNLVHQGWVE